MAFLETVFAARRLIGEIRDAGTRGGRSISATPFPRGLALPYSKTTQTRGERHGHVLSILPSLPSGTAWALLGLWASVSPPLK